MATRKGYLAALNPPAYPDEDGLLSARQALSLTPSGSEILIRQGRSQPVFTQEVLPNLSNTPTARSADQVTPGATMVAGTTPGGEGESEPSASTSPQPGLQAGEPTPSQTPQTVNLMQFPILVNDSSLRLINDPSTTQSYLVQATSPGQPSYQYVQVLQQGGSGASNSGATSAASNSMVASTLS